MDTVMMTAGGDSVLFHSKVGKVGADGSSLPRGVFVTPATLLLCLTAGGITRTVSLANVLEVSLGRSEAGGVSHRCTVRVRGEALLVLDFANQEDVDGFIDAIRRAASHVCILQSGMEAPREKNIALEGSRSVAKEVHFADALESLTASLPPPPPPPPPATGGTHHRLSSPSSSVRPALRSSSHAIKTPVEPLESVGRTGVFDVLPEAHLSPFRREPVARSLGSPAANATLTRGNGHPHIVRGTSPLYETDPIRSAPLCLEPTGSPHAQYDLHASIGPIISTDLEIRKQEVSWLRDQLQEKNAFIEDLKSALRSQENVFHEMLKTAEQLRLVEGSRSQLEKQVGLLQAEVNRLEGAIKKSEADHQGELAMKLTELQETHSKEVVALQEAFAQYDAQMTEYVENLQTDKERETRRWNERERLLQKQIDSQKQEIAELVNTLASQEANPPDAAALEGDKVGGTRVLSTSHQKCGAVQRSREPPPVNLSTPALEFRLASLEEEHARTRLREKLHAYTGSRKHIPSGVLFNSNGRDEQREHEKAAADGLVTSKVSPRSCSRPVYTPSVGVARNDVVPSLVSTPGALRGTRNRAII